MAHIWHWLAEPRHGLTLWFFIGGATLIGALILVVLTAVPAKFRKPIVILVTFLGGLFLSLEFLIPTRNVFTKAAPTLANVQIVVGSFTLLLGIFNLFQIHGKAVAKRKSGWANSLAFFIAFFAILIAGFMKDAKGGVYADVFGILFGGFLLALQSTMFSLIAFYIVSAAYRAFRIRSMEAVLMMVAAGIIMLALVPVGTIITSWLPETGILSALRLENIGYWLLTSPNMAVQRAIAFGIAVGALATGLRIWLRLERGSFFDREL